MQNNRGITLIALTITIIVLIIIAAVTVRQVTNKDIISEAQSAREQYLAVQGREEDEIQDTANFIKEIKDQAKTDEESGSGVTIEPKTTYQFTVENDRSYEVNAGTTWEQFANASNGVFVPYNKGIQHSTLGRVRLGEHPVVRAEAIQDGAIYNCSDTTGTGTDPEPGNEPAVTMITFTVAGIEYQVAQGTTWGEFVATNNNFEIFTTTTENLMPVRHIVYLRQYQVFSYNAVQADRVYPEPDSEIINGKSYLLEKMAGEFSDI